MKCPTCGRRETRSSEANRRYWALIGLLMEKQVEKGLSYSKEDWHDVFKMKFLGADEVKLPNGKPYLRLKSTHNLSTPEFNDYAHQVEAWCNERDIWLDE